MAFEVMLPPGGGPLIFEWRRACSGTVEAASVFSQLPLTLSPCVPCPPTADCGLEITRIAQVGHKGGQGNGWEGGESEGEARRAGGRGANRGRRGGGPPWRARASVASLLSCFFFFPFALEPPPAPLRSRAPPAVCALQQRGRGVHVYVRLCVLCGACAQLPLHRQGARFHGPRSHGPPSFSRTPAPTPRSRPSPPHSQHPRHPHTHTHPSSLHTIFQGSCSSLRPVFYSNAAGFSAYSGSADCVGAQGAVAVMVPAGALTAACCADMRSFAAAGCTCDADVMELLVGLKVLPAGASPDATMGGIVALFQASQCAGAALGGPLLDACTGGVGCVATA